MLDELGFFALGLLLLTLGGDSLIKGASGLAQRLGLSPFASGLLLVAFGTSLPELAVNARAVYVGEGELALGNAVGSNLVNLGLTLGVAALAAPLLLSMRLLAANVAVVIAASLLVLLFALDGALARWEGAVLLLGFVAFVVFAIVRGRREEAGVQAELADFAATRDGLGLNLLRFAVAALALYYGARYVVAAAPLLGAALGFGPLLSGLTLVAIGTALPEIAAAIAAARRGQGNVVAGHALGASVFNLLLIVGGMAALRPLALPESFVRLELPAAIAFALALYPMLRGDLTISRREGGILVVLFVVWLAFELFLAWG